MVAAPLRGSDYEDQKLTCLGFLVRISFCFLQSSRFWGFKVGLARGCRFIS